MVTTVMGLMATMLLSVGVTPTAAAPVSATPEDTAPIRTLTGAATGLNIPRSVAIAPDGSIIATDAQLSLVVEFAPGADGNATPVRRLTSSSGLSDPQVVARLSDGKLAVTVRSPDRVLIFAADANTGATALRTIQGASTGLANPTGIVELSNGQLAVVNANTITIYAADANGDAAPVRTIAGAATGLQSPWGVTQMPSGEIAATNRSTNTVTFYAADASGNAAPVRTIGGANTTLSGPYGLAPFPDGRLAVTRLGAREVTVFAAGASGNVAPVRIIGGDSTGLNAPIYPGVLPNGDIAVANFFGNSITVYPRDPQAPGAPTALSASAGLDTAQVSFTAPTDDGDSEITNYEYTLDASAETPTWMTPDPPQTTSPITITGLTPGTTYSIALRAVNAIGAGPASTPVSVTPGYARAATWGSDYDGQLGAGTSGPATISPVPLAVNTTGVLAGKVISQVTGGNDHACALTTDGEVFCWGSNNAGQLGDGSNDSSDVPVAVDTSGALDGKSVVGIDAGGTHTCARTSDGAAHCWGNNNFGQLGNNSNASSDVPVTVDTSGVLNGKTVTDISTGLYQSCVATSDGGAYCWGYNFYGQLGNGTNTISSVPVAVSTAGVLTGETVTAVAAGQSHTCALSLDGEVFCWGANGNGQLGDNTITNSNVPVAVDTAGVLSGKSLTGVTAGVSHTCGWDVTGAAYCWGANADGQLGTGNNTNSRVPVAVSTSGALAGQGVVDVTTGDYYTCAATSAGQAYCWGSNVNGELGDGTQTARNEPTAVVSTGVLSDGPVTQVAAGAYFSLAIYDGSGATPPAAPTELVATGGARSASIAFTAGADGGEPITDYQYRFRVTASSSWSEWTSAGVAVSPVPVTGLADATSYDVQLRAVNVIGTGVVAETTVTTAALPAAPESLAVAPTGGSGELEATFTAGAAGGSPITDYEYRLGSGVAPGTPDAAFNAAIDAVLNGPFLGVEAVLVQPDGKVVVGGSFTSPSTNLARFNADGTPDTTFNSAVGTTLPSEVSSLALQPDGKILVGGAYAPVAFTVKRYNSDGTPDTAFNGNVERDLSGNSVDGIAVQSDGKIVIGGDFNGPISSYLARLNADGTQDFDFNFGVRWVYAPATALAIQADGAVLAGFGSSSGSLGTLARFTADGEQDVSFNSTMETALNGGVDSIAVQSDQKIVVGGAFTAPSAYVARFESNGDTDTAFSSDVGSTFDARVRSVAVQNSGSILAGGDFIGPSHRLARLNASGAPDRSFNSAVGRDINETVFAVASTADDAVLAGGRFSTPANALARFVSGYGAWTSAGVTESPFTISGLTNGTTYDVQVRAVSAVGAGAVAGPVQGTPEPVPTAPTNLRVLPRDGGVTISFTPGDDFGVGIDNYEYRLDGGAWTAFSPVQTASPVTITGLDNYTAYSVELRAVNSVGDGAASAPVTFAPSPGRLFAWGSNVNGSFGNGTSAGGSNVPVIGAQALIDAGESIIDVAGGGSMNCAVTQAGQVYCWGSGYLGDGEESGQSSVPVQAGTAGPMAGETIVDVAVGLNSACALSDEGQVFCWGDGFFGQLGNDSYDSALTPVAVNTAGALDGKTVTQIASGAFYMCALTSEGKAYCWGSNAFGALGIGSAAFGPGPNTPQAVDTSGALSGRSLAQIDAGTFTVCAVDTAGVAYCWGRNNAGQLGDGTTDDAASPTPVTTTGPLGGAAVVDINVGNQHACAVRANGTAACWGNNDSGQLGNGTTDASLVPVAVAGGGVLAGQTLNSISVNEFRTCAVTDSGAVFCWGSGSDGGLGNGTDETSLVPAAVVSTGALVNSQVVQVVVNDYDTLAWAPIPTAVPGPPTSVSWSPTDTSGKVTFAFSAPAPNGGPDVTGYEYSPCEADSPECPWNPLTYTGTGPYAAEFSGLRDGQLYIARLRAVNEVGGGAPVTVQFTAGVPSAPLGVVATPGDSGVAVSFEPPEFDGGSAVTNFEYRVRTAEGPGVWGEWVVPSPPWTFSPLPVMGLVNGTGYEVEIRAVNANGAGVVSEVAGPVTPSGGVDAPTGVVGELTLTPGEVLVSWTAPVSSGGVPVTAYEVLAFEVAGPSPSPSPSVSSSPSPSPSPSVSPSPTSTDDPPEPTPTPTPTPSPSPVGSCEVSGDPAATECVVDGLSLGSSYVFVVTASNGAGSVSDPSAASASVLVVGPAGAPTGLVGVPTGVSGQVKIEFTAPVDSGGGTISGYEYTTDGGVSWVSAGTAVSPVTIDGLDDGTAYTVALRAVNQFGAGETSVSVVVTPRTTPAAPSGLSASPGDSSAVISFTAGGDGGSPITNYEYQLDGGAWTVLDPAQDASPVTVSGLSNGTGYSIKLRAVNAAGAGAASDAVVVTPRTVPGAPTITTVTPGDQQISVVFTAPVSNGGSQVTDYEYRVSGLPGGWDAAFNAAVGTQLNGSVLSVVVQDDGKVVVGGEFTNPANYLARFNADGTPDVAFNTNVGLALDEWVTTVALQPDGDIVVGGLFSAPSSYVARLNSDGTPDTTFNTNVGTTLNDFVSSVVVQPDGKILVGGEFIFPASPSSGVVRFNADGTADDAFNGAVGATVNGGVDSVALQGDGRVVIGGAFTSPSSRLARFNTDGAADVDFNQAIGTALDARVFSVAVQPDGGVVTGGLFTSPAPYLARFNSDGAPDATFNAKMASTVDGAVTEVSLDADGGVVVGGFFTTPASGVARFTADGTPDAVFNAEVGTLLSDPVYSVVQDADGDVVVGGMFTSPSSYLARFDGGVGPWTSAGSTVSPIVITGLVNGTSYDVALRAVNAAGEGAASSVSVGVTPFGKPQAPGGVAGVAGPGVGAVTVSWTALVDAPSGSPNSNGATVSQYAGLVYSGSTFVGQCRATGQDATSCVVSGLTPGSYTVLVRARNVAGWGPSGVGSVPVSPAVLAGAPTVVSVSPGDGQVVVVFTAPTDSGGVPVTNYEYTTDGGTTWVSPDPAVTSSPLTITGLVNGTSYSVGVRAVTSAGAGAASSPLVAVVPRTIPGAPSVTSVTPADGQITVDFTAPGDGGAAITNYEYSTDGGTSWVTPGPAVTASPIVIGGLTNGVAYDVAIRAVNPAGAGAASAVSADVVPFGKPQAPGNVSGAAVVGGAGQVRISWSALVNAPDAAPNSNGAAVSQYAGLVYAGSVFVGQCRASGQVATSCVVSGLTAGVSYVVLVRARNAAGWGPSGVGSVPVAPFGVPGAPVITTTNPGDASFAVGFTAAAANGAAVSNYQFSTDGGSTWRSLSPPVTGAGPFAVIITRTSTGAALVNGSTYQVQLRAVNSFGAGAATASTAVTLPALPGAPSITSAVPTNISGQVSVVFTAPGYLGVPEVSNYQFSTDDGLTWTTRSPAATASPLVIDGLVDGQEYSVKLRAVNTKGAGPASNMVTVIPISPPGAPATFSVAPNEVSGQLAVSFTAPTSTGGTPVTGYEYRVRTSEVAGEPPTPAGVWGAWTAAGTTISPFTITGLTNGTSYDVELRAVNVAGSGPAAGPQSATPRTIPGVPGNLAVGPNEVSGELVVTWDAPTDEGGSTITGYEYRLDGGSWLPGSASPLTLTGLTNGTEYEVEIRAVNAAGAGTPAGPVTGTPRTVPSAPQGLTATHGDASATLTFGVPADDGGATITGYEYSTNGGVNWLALVTTGSAPVTALITATSTGDPLVNGDLYEVRVRAVNAAGEGASASASFTPSTRPATPTGVSATAGDEQLAVSWTAPDDGGATITSYLAIAYDSGGLVAATCRVTGDPAATGCTITGLTNGQPYTVAVRASNLNGQGPQNTPVGPYTPAR